MTKLYIVEELRAQLTPGVRLLGLDVGTKTIGMALSDITLTIASPLDTIRRKKWREDSQILSELVKSHGIGGFVVGLPLNMDGSDSPRTQGVRTFASNLTKAIPLPTAYWDERWSTMAVERTLLEADTSRSKRANVVDKMAASYILQSALHAL